MTKKSWIKINKKKTFSEMKLNCYSFRYFFWFFCPRFDLKMAFQCSCHFIFFKKMLKFNNFAIDAWWHGAQCTLYIVYSRYNDSLVVIGRMVFCMPQQKQVHNKLWCFNVWHSRLYCQLIGNGFVGYVGLLTFS